jgi:SAM-dependent methyltransferase
MDEGYFASYRILTERHFWWRARDVFLVELLSALTPDGRFGDILDVGCGKGLSFPLLSRFGAVEGVEPFPFPAGMEGASNRIHNVPFDDRFSPGKSFGLILMLDSLEHMPDAQAALETARGLLLDRGFLVLTVPAFMALWTSHDDLNHHQVRFTKSSLGPLLIFAGFEIVEMRYFFQWIAPCKLVTRALERLWPRAPRPPVIPPWPLNQLAGTLSRLEWRTYGRILQAFGSSLLAVARKR